MDILTNSSLHRGNICSRYSRNLREMFPCEGYLFPCNWYWLVTLNTCLYTDICLWPTVLTYVYDPMFSVVTSTLYHVIRMERLHIMTRIMWIFLIITQIVSLIYNHFMTGNTSVCGWLFEYTDNITFHVVPRKHVFKIFY